MHMPAVPATLRRTTLEIVGQFCTHSLPLPPPTGGMYAAWHPLMLITSLRRLALASLLTALPACDELGPAEEPPTPALDAQADGELGEAVDTGASDAGDAASPPPAPQPDAAAPDGGGDAGGSVDATVDATSHAPDATSSPDGEVPLVTPCTGANCCMPLVSKSNEPSTVCQAELCLAQQTFYVGGDGEMRVINSCGTDEYGRLFSYHKNGGIASVALYARGASCQTTDAAALRAGIWKVVASGETFDARTFEWSAATLTGPGSLIQELELKDGHLRMVIEGAITSANTIGAISPDCLHGEFIPIGLCNCRHEGVGPKAKVVVDLLIRD